MPLCPSDQPTSYSLSPYSGPWTQKEASHLLRRTTFGPTQAQINSAISDGVFLTVENLLQISSVDAPLTWYNGEAYAPFGSTWVTSFLPADQVLRETKLKKQENIQCILGFQKNK